MNLTVFIFTSLRDLLIKFVKEELQRRMVKPLYSIDFGLSCF